MGVDIRLAAVVLLATVIAQVFTGDIDCSYMQNIPRPDTPNFPPLDFTGTTWAQRPLLPVARREDLCMEHWRAVESTQVIYMEEEIDGEVTIAKLNYQGTEVPTIGNFQLGTFINLSPEIRRVGEEWHLVITARQDYEMLDLNRYMFNIRVPGQSLSPFVSLVIVNIDDNPPILQVFDPCQTDELGDPRATECVYTVRDPDGYLSTRYMKFKLSSDRGDEDIFNIVGQNVQQFQLEMVVVILKPLDFVENQLHVFTVTATDSGDNSQSATVMVQVQNVNSRVPRWVNTFAVQQFNEKTIQSFPLRAIDGDTGINRPMKYTLITEEEDTFFSLETLGEGRDGAILHIDKIDRDKLQREVFRLSVVAHKDIDPTLAEPTNIVIIVNDVNDQRPEPMSKDYHISIPEETPLTLTFNEPFGFHDSDLGEHAQYEVRLVDEEPAGAADALQIHPKLGYQEQNFVMSTENHGVLDYENLKFQNIVLQVVATDMNDSSHVGVARVHITLENWNDELPMFEQDSYTARFKETVGAGFHVATVRAHDADIDDEVVHSLMGNADQFFTIDKSTGEIFVAHDNSFDYHRQNVIFVQVLAEDTLGDTVRHTATAQLRVELEDVNNTPPTLSLPRVSPNVQENIAAGIVIEGVLRASDPDTTAELEFEINWEDSWATKAGRDTPEEEFRGCLAIKTTYPDPEDTRTAEGQLIVREIKEGVTIDFEEFEVLHLSVRVKDLKTELNQPYSEAMYTIRVIDMNDNAPTFAPEQLAQALRVREGSAGGVVIGSVLATDIDGPLYNQVRYTIAPREGSGTPEGLVKIDFVTGQMTVDTEGAIDADQPRTYHLYYTVVATDRCFTEPCPPDQHYHETPAPITIEVIDTNDQVPQAETEKYDTVVKIPENTPHGTEIRQLVSSDLDRDEMYNTVRYAINFMVNPRLRSFFDVDPNTGVVFLNFEDEVLDRDGEEPTHTIFLTLSDNFNRDGDGRQNQVETVLEVILLDVNDNPPVLPDLDGWSISENTQSGHRLTPTILATDRDDPNLDNSLVGFQTGTLTVSNRDDIEPPGLFAINWGEGFARNTAALETALPLRGYWGTYSLTIRAFDHGDPQLDTTKKYEIVVVPYNFHHPVFQFPLTETTIRLSRELAVNPGLLWTAANNPLEHLQATDEDGLEAGEVTFSVVGNEVAMEFFRVDGQILMLQKTWDNEERIREFRVTIRATDRGTDPGPLSTDSVVTLLFVPTQGDPVFVTNTQTVSFREGETGITQYFTLQEANDEKNYGCVDDECLNIYYRITEGNSDGAFTLEPKTNVLRLARPLSRAAGTSRVLRVAASNLPDASNAPGDASTLIVTVNVLEADPRPVFTQDLYTAGISTEHAIGRELLVVKATHTEDTALRYHIDQDSMVADSSLEAVKATAFRLNKETGLLVLNIQPTASMHGMFDFNVIATDSRDMTGKTQVRVFLVSSRNRVDFIFQNPVEDVTPHRDFIEQVFSLQFNMLCNVESVLPEPDENGNPREDRTRVRAHFIRDDLPVTGDVIEEMRSDMTFVVQLQQRLNVHELLLSDMVTSTSGAGGGDAARTAVYVLAALSALLALLCLVLLLTFYLRTRALKRRLEALSMTKYGSVDSGLNRAGLAPGTNKHAAEGSNPIWNEAIKAPDFDAMSDASNDSDLIGIEDLPQFREDYFPPADARSIDQIVGARGAGDREPVATHGNNFGFNTSPFSPDFANKQFRR